MTPLTKLLVESMEEIELTLQYKVDDKYVASEKTALDEEDFLKGCNDVKAVMALITPVSDSLIRKAYLLGLERAKEVISPITPDRKNGLSILKDPLVPIPKDKRMSVAIGYQQAKVDAEKALDSAIGETNE